ncbi:hypothetical protein CI109_102185 [Kwoniella shandongensis]|uniref:Sulphur transport domain-containing protein n=1 Tax=Kwoniella shandongensis TaxID=1734106 RepID=A0A5M6C038_9TREE|nr:uncharacterized protein CI109_003656 [Kwoniella shandongensis]KAA5528001.1 hypothetical protein CI109_003656 [Kwoniella shandongensis]
MPFTPIQTFVGGLLLHISTSSLLADTGRVFGISGILNGALFQGHERWQWAILAGLVSGPMISSAIGLTSLFPGDALTSLKTIGVKRLAIAGILVGFGSKLGSGCTSGHMLCGLSRLSPRSIVATGVFFTSAVITANLSVHPHSVIPAYSMALPPTSVTTALFAVAGIAASAYYGLRNYLTSRHPVSVIIRTTPYFFAALIFSLGLSISGMTDPAKVLGFLRFPTPHDFDPSLAMVMLGGVLPNAIHYHWVTRASEAQRRSTRLLPWEKWSVPTRRDIDRRLILGAGIFGIGWGLIWICPGPALVNLGAALVNRDLAALRSVSGFISAMMAGMYAANVI